jgi:hypothetical protein
MPRSPRRWCPSVSPARRPTSAGAKKLGELTAITSVWEQTEFVMKTEWATFPGQADPNRDVAEACASAVLKTATAK